MRLSPWIIVSLLLFASLLAGVTFTMNASADSTVTLTSTADFDAGNKGSVQDSTPGSWADIAVTPQPVADAVGTVLGGYIWSLGGYQTSGSDVKRFNFRYNPATNTWAQKGLMEFARFGAAIGTYGTNRIYVFSGQGPVNPTLSAEYYDINTDGWTQVTDIPTDFGVSGVAGICGVTSGASIYLVANGALVRYSPISDTYVSLSSPSNTGTFPSCGIVGSNLYVIGGTSSGNPSKVLKYSIATGTWDNSYDTIPGVPNSRYGMNPTSIINGEFYLSNGHIGNTLFYREMWKYNPVTKSKTLMEPGKYARDGITGVAFGGKVYVWGGRSDAISPVGTPNGEVFTPSGTTSDGNAQVETNTDNPSIADGTFTLASVGGDRFNRLDRDGVTFKWNSLWDIRGLCVTDANTDHTFEFGPNTTGSLFTSSDETIPSCTEVSRSAFGGDFNVSVKITRIAGDFPRLQLLNEPVINWDSDGTVDGTLIEYSSSGANTNVFVWTVTNGGASACGSNPTSLTGSSHYIRITRVSNTWTYYDGTNGISYTQFRQCTNSNSGPFYAVFNVYNSAKGSWDDWNVASSGTVGPGWFRTMGTWTSGLQMTDGLSTVRSVTLTYSGVSVNGYIDSVAIVDAGGHVTFQDNTDRKSGTSSTVVVPSAFGEYWAVRITLKGNGQNTPVVQNVAVNLGPSKYTNALDALWILLFVSLLIIGAIVAWKIRGRL